MRKLVLSLLFISIYLIGKAQEFNLEVSVVAPRLSIADPKVMKTLERSISEFFNDRKWTKDEYETEERIEGTVQINISEDKTATSFVGSLLISAARPVFNSNYTTALVTHIDNDFKIQYEENQPLRDNTLAFTDNLSSILTCYAYILLGHDYDSFSEYGGSPYFKKAQTVIANVPPSVTNGNNGWTAAESERNKYWIVENLLNPKFRPYRKAFYEYHRDGLDLMADNALIGKANILKALKSIDRINRSFRKSMIIQMFSNSKNKEILEIYRNSLKPEQREVYNILSTIDPAQSSVVADLR